MFNHMSKNTWQLLVPNPYVLSYKMFDGRYQPTLASSHWVQLIITAPVSRYFSWVAVLSIVSAGMLSLDSWELRTHGTSPNQTSHGCHSMASLFSTGPPNHSKVIILVINHPSCRQVTGCHCTWRKDLRWALTLALRSRRGKPWQCAGRGGSTAKRYSRGGVTKALPENGWLWLWL